MSSLPEDHFKIAVVDDDEIFRDYACALVSSNSGYVPYPAASGEELFGILNQQHIDCILLDYDLGGDTGLSVKRKLNYFFGETPPTVMITGDVHVSTAIEALSLGVVDCISKREIDPTALMSTITTVINNTQLRQNSKPDPMFLTEAADPRTGLTTNEVFFIPSAVKYSD